MSEPRSTAMRTRRALPEPAGWSGPLGSTPGLSSSPYLSWGPELGLEGWNARAPGCGQGGGDSQSLTLTLHPMRLWLLAEQLLVLFLTLKLR